MIEEEERSGPASPFKNENNHQSNSNSMVNSAPNDGASVHKKNGTSCSSADAAVTISCLELDAWIRDDESMDCMMLLPEVPLDGDSPSAEESMHHSSGASQDCCEPISQPNLCNDVECNHESGSIFCRSSSSCSTTFPDTRHHQETLELNLPDDFFDDKQQGGPMSCSSQEQINLPGLTERPRCNGPPDLKKIIVKKPVMDKAVERLGGGRRGALRLWNIIQVWLRCQQQQQQQEGSSTPGSASLDGLMLPFENIGAEFLNFPSLDQQNAHQVFSSYNEQHNAGAQQFSCFAEPQMVPQPAAAGATYCSFSTDLTQAVPACSSAATTRAARKSRMARQRRHRGGVGSGGNHHLNLPSAASSTQAWSSASSFLPGASRNHAVELHHQQQQFGSCRDKASTEKNVKFLLQKELKPSDVGNLGRIVLPKKEAEVHLPYLSLREGITLAMEDAVTLQTWHFRYRFWPNNKSRMYLLEGTGEFVKYHHLKEGDILQIFRDCKSGKHMIFGKRGVGKQDQLHDDQQQHKVDDDCLSGASTISEDHQLAKEDSSAEIEKFPSIDMADEFIDEILGLVDEEEPSSPESCKEDC